MEHIEKKLEEHNRKLDEHNQKIITLEQILVNINNNLEKISVAIEKQDKTLYELNIVKQTTHSEFDRIYERIRTLEGKETEHNKRFEKTEKEYRARIDRVEKSFIEQLNTRPCITHNVVETEIKHIKEQVATHKKIFWWVTTAIIGTLMVGIIKGNLK